MFVLPRELTVPVSRASALFNYNNVNCCHFVENNFDQKTYKDANPFTTFDMMSVSSFVVWIVPKRLL